MRKKPIFFLLALVIGVFVSLAFWRSDGDRQQANSQEAVHHYHASCLRERAQCIMHLISGLELHLGIDPFLVKPLERFQVSLNLPSVKNEDVSSLEVWVEGRDMEMGRHYLLPVKSGDNTEWSRVVSGMIPVCTVDRNMIWQMVASFEYQGERHVVHTDLNSDLHGE